MSTDDIAPQPPSAIPRYNPQQGMSTQEVAEQGLEVSFIKARTNLEELLKMNFGVLQELLGQIAAINPFRPDSAMGKQPEVATVEASKSVQSAPVAPVGKAGAAAYIAGLQYINDALTQHDTQLQQVFDQLALSRSGRKPDLFNHGVEYDRIMTYMHQAEMRLQRMEQLVPETLPSYTQLPLKELMPELSDRLQQYDAGFQLINASIKEGIRQARSK